MKLFVAKLNRDVQDEHLVELFSQYGEVAYARVVTDRDTGQSKCFGFVQMKEKAAAEAAMEALNGKEFMRFPMVVKEAEERARPASAPGRPSKPAPASGARDFSRRPGEARDAAPDSPATPAAAPAPKKKTPAKRKERDMWADGPRQPRLKGKDRPKYNDWLGDLDDE
jgi:RNA recognition motif-containing protein